MKITIPLKLNIDPAQFANVVSAVDADGRRTVALEVGTPTEGVECAVPGLGVSIKANARIRIASVLSRAEAAAALGITEEAVAALSAETVARDAPFVVPQAAKIIASLDSVSAAAYAAQFPALPWVVPAVENGDPML
jgi:hypothetical protein